MALNNPAVKKNKMNILAISGSLRTASINTLFLNALSKIAPDEIKISLYQGLGSLPLFNPDLEGHEPDTVLNYQTCLQTADGIIIASPEYAHGITGSMKNALDWVVASGEFVYKPVVLYNTSPRASHAYAALKETLSVMDSQIIEEACLKIPLLGSKLTIDEIVTHPDFAPRLRHSLKLFVCAIHEKLSTTPI